MEQCHTFILDPVRVTVLNPHLKQYQADNLISVLHYTLDRIMQCDGDDFLLWTLTMEDICGTAYEMVSEMEYEIYDEMIVNQNTPDEVIRVLEAQGDEVLEMLVNELYTSMIILMQTTIYQIRCIFVKENKFRNPYNRYVLDCRPDRIVLKLFY